VIECLLIINFIRDIVVIDTGETPVKFIKSSHDSVAVC